MHKIMPVSLYSAGGDQSEKRFTMYRTARHGHDAIRKKMEDNDCIWKEVIPAYSILLVSRIHKIRETHLLHQEINSLKQAEHVWRLEHWLLMPFVAASLSSSVQYQICPSLQVWADK